MKKILLLMMLALTFCAGCAPKEKNKLPDHMPDNATTISTEEAQQSKLPEFMTQQGYEDSLTAIDIIDSFLSSKIEKSEAEECLYELSQSIHIKNSEISQDKYKNQLLAGAYVGTLYGDIKSYAPGVASKDEKIKEFRDKLAELVNAETKYQ